MARVIKAGDAHGEGPAAEVLKVLKLTDFVAEAREIVLDARKQAARIVAEAAGKAEQAEQAARDRGYAEGFARGQNDGYAAGQQSGSRQGLEASAGQAVEGLSVAQRIAEELAARRGELLDQARRELLEFALAVAERIVGPVARRDISAAQANLASALEMAGLARAITVKVNPAQLEGLREHCREAVEAMAIKGRVELVGDETISPGGVKLLTGGGQIDATVETQLDHIAKALLGSEEPGDAAAPPQTGGQYESHRWRGAAGAQRPATVDGAAGEHDAV